MLYNAQLYSKLVCAMLVTVTNMIELVNFADETNRHAPGWRNTVTLKAQFFYTFAEHISLPGKTENDVYILPSHLPHLFGHIYSIPGILSFIASRCRVDTALNFWANKFIV